MQTVQKSLFYSFLGNYALLVVQLVSTMILSRLLTPKEIGIFSVAVVFVGLAQVFRDFGVARYIIQEEDLTVDRLKAAFSITLIIGWLSAIIIFFSAPYIGDFYEQKGVQKVLELLSINFFLIPFGSITLSYLRRLMEFNKYAIIQISSAVVGACTAILTGYFGESYLSLAWSSIAATLTTVIVAFVFRPETIPFLPGIKEIKHVVSYGTLSSLSSASEHVGHSSPEWIMGKTIGMESVGLYSRAQGTISIFNKLVLGAVNQVIEPLFARIKREKQDYREPYLFAVSCITGLSWPFFSFLALMAQPIFRVLYGDKWDEAIPLMQVWCLAAAIYALIAFARNIYAVIGYMKVLLKVQMTLDGIKVIALLITSYFWGVLAVVWVILGITILQTAIFHQLNKKILGVYLIDYYSIFWKGAVLTGVSSGLTFFSYQFIVVDSSCFFQVIISGILWSFGLISSMIIVNHPLGVELRRLLKKFNTIS